MKLESVAKFDKRNTATSKTKKTDYNIVSASCNAIVIFPNYG